MTEIEKTENEKNGLSADISKKTIDGTPSAALAYLGDSVIETLVRKALVLSGVKSPSVASLKYVTAPNQSDALERILPELDEDEISVFKRGRNGVHSGIPKRSTAAQYRRATGFEALFGYLYLAERFDRITQLFYLAYPDLGDAD